MVPASIPGLVALHAVDDAGVHPLCLALAHERFSPYAKPEDREPLELLKTANAILGFNQASLTKYLLIAAAEDEEAVRKIDINDVAGFFRHVLERIDFSRDLHFETSTSIDTLDYTGSKLNHGSKLTIATAGLKKRELRNNPEDLQTLQIPGITSAKITMPGVIVLQGPAYDEAARDSFMAQIEEALAHWEFRENYPWISIVDSALDSSLDTGNLRDFLWLTFTRSDPAKDVFGYHAQICDKHWRCAAPLMIDARIKPHHQKTLTVPAEISERARRILAEEKIIEESK
jgi:4-hydroxy-3-polyprenylbenzoate decarboxylase